MGVLGWWGARGHTKVPDFESSPGGSLGSGSGPGPGSDGDSGRAQRACSAGHGSSPPSFPSRAQQEEGEGVEAEFRTKFS